MYRESHWVKVEFEEDPRCSFAMFQYSRVMGHAILICLYGVASRGDIGRWDDVEEVLVCDEGYTGVNKAYGLFSEDTYDRS